MVKTPTRRKRPPRKAKAQAVIPPPPTVDRLKLLHVTVALAPSFATEFFYCEMWEDAEECADALVHLATAIAKRL